MDFVFGTDFVKHYTRSVRDFNILPNFYGISMGYDESYKYIQCIRLCFIKILIALNDLFNTYYLNKLNTILKEHFLAHWSVYLSTIYIPSSAKSKLHNNLAKLYKPKPVPTQISHSSFNMHNTNGTEID